ncbi:MAG: DUF429 domain-containing protein, partial [Pseudomonadota bacterium]
MGYGRRNRSFATFVGVDLGGGKGKNTAVALLQRREQAGESNVRVVYVGTRTPSGQLFHDEVLLKFIREHGKEALLAIDAPLVPTVCMRCSLAFCAGLGECTDPVVRWFRKKGDKLVSPERTRHKPPTTPYTQRACEVILYRKHGIPPREALGQGMGPLTARAHYLQRTLEPDFTLNKNLIEVYPKATVQQLFGAERAQRYKREVNTWRTRAELLEALREKLIFEVWREGCLQNDHCFDAVVCAFTGFLW